jgi:hypothetical protein
LKLEIFVGIGTKVTIAELPLRRVKSCITTKGLHTGSSQKRRRMVRYRKLNVECLNIIVLCAKMVMDNRVWCCKMKMRTPVASEETDVPTIQRMLA